MAHGLQALLPGFPSVPRLQGWDQLILKRVPLLEEVLITVK